jgi:hypothetical protein
MLKKHLENVIGGQKNLKGTVRDEKLVFTATIYSSSQSPCGILSRFGIPKSAILYNESHYSRVRVRE